MVDTSGVWQSPTSLSAFAQRIDKHMVIIGLSMDISKGVAAVAAVLPLAVGKIGAAEGQRYFAGGTKRA